MFAYRLAGHLKKPVAWLVDNLPDEEWTFWQAYCELEPFGNEWRTHQELVAVLRSTLYHANGGKWTDPTKFMPKLRKKGRVSADIKIDLATLDRTLDSLGLD